MKKIFGIFFICLIVSGSKLIAQVTTTMYAGVSITYETNNNILKFNSVADVNTVLDQLDADYESYNDSYENKFPNLTADQLDSIDEATGFDEFASLKSFEALFSGFISRRSIIETTENTWLLNDLSGTDPDDIDFAFDDAENTIFNNSYLLKIGDDIYELRSDGLYNLSTGDITDIPKYSNIAMTEIKNVDEQMGLNGNTLFNYFENENNLLNSNLKYISQIGIETRSDRLHNNNSLIFTSQQTVNNQTNYGNCVGNIRNKHPFAYGNDRQFELKVAVNSSLFRSSAKGKVVSLKRKNNGHFKRSRMEMAVGCSGNIYDAGAFRQCTLFKQLDKRNPTSGYKKRKSLKTIERNAIPVKYRTKSGEFRSYYQLPDGTANILQAF